MEVKPSFFSITGFLVPGIVLVSLVAWFAGVHAFGSLSDALAALPKLPADNGLAVLVGTLFVAALLASTFVLGAILSEAFTFVARQLIIRRFIRPKLRENVQRLFAHDTLESLIRLDMDARESYVYMQTNGLDLHWYAGRIRMLGGTGFALLVAAVAALFFGQQCGVILCLLFIAALAMAAAIYRSNKFDEYIAAASAVLAREGAKGKPASIELP